MGEDKGEGFYYKIKQKVKPMIQTTKYTNKTLPVLLREPKILVIGGGKVAYQKVKVLTQNKIDFKIISENVCEEIKLLNSNYIEKKFEEDDVKGFHYIIDATGNDDVKTLLQSLKLQHKFLLNCVD